MLDFSGGSGQRIYDHRQIAEVVATGTFRKAVDTTGTDAMLKFMRRGAIRMQMSAPPGKWRGTLFLDFARMPTPAQWCRVADLIQQSEDGILEIAQPKGYGKIDSLLYQPWEKPSIAWLREWLASHKVR